MDSGRGEREVVKRVIPRAHMASATKIHLKEVGLDKFEPCPASPIHAVRTSAEEEQPELGGKTALGGFKDEDQQLAARKKREQEEEGAEVNRPKAAIAPRRKTREHIELFTYRTGARVQSV